MMTYNDVMSVEIAHFLMLTKTFNAGLETFQPILVSLSTFISNWLHSISANCICKENCQLFQQVFLLTTNGAYLLMDSRNVTKEAMGT